MPPIRSPAIDKNTLHELGTNIASGKILRLPQFLPFSFQNRLTHNAKLILDAFRTADAAYNNNTNINTAHQWLIDNYYTIDESIRKIKKSFSKKFLNQLPGSPLLKNTPGILVLSWFYVAHTDSTFSIKTLTNIVKGYQKIAPCHIKELWALASFIDFVLIENLQRIITAIKHSNQMQITANQIAEKIILTKDKKEVEQLLFLCSKLIADTTFSSHLFYRLRNMTSDMTHPLIWLEKHLIENGTSLEEAINTEQDQQISYDIMIGNIIRSLKAIHDVDWTLWLENISYVDILLKNKSDFSEVDPCSRNSYRNAIEKIAQRSPLSEFDIANKAVKLSQNETKPRKKTIAYYLIGAGSYHLKKTCLYQQTISERFFRFFKGMTIGKIAIPISLLTLSMIVSVYSFLQYKGMRSSLAVSFSILSLFPAMEISYSVFNTIVSWFIKPVRLIGFEYKDGIPKEAKTLIAVPTILSSLKSIEDHIETLECHYLSNPHGAISLALVTDWPDADSALVKGDYDLLDHAKKNIQILNERYSQNGRQIFFLLHRKRLYNKSERCWMGWERKRGKLHELNQLLRGKKDTSFLESDHSLPSKIHFIMTLDCDTRLTPGSINKLVGKLNHPLNKAEFCCKSGRVINGYTILQPRLISSLTFRDKTSLFQRIFSGDSGIDPYTLTTSDPYQDLLGEGTFIGKGLYEIDAFEKALKGCIHENTVLSHDMLEGGYARTALVSDIEVIEDYPTTYHVDIARRHRWARGDWQLLPYLFKKPPMNLITRWKLQDNLRRTLTPIFWIIASLSGWCLLPKEIDQLWQIFLLSEICIAPLLKILRDLLSINRDFLIRSHCRFFLKSLADILIDISLKLVFIANVTSDMTDAIIRTLYRIGISHSHLLEWRTSTETQDSPNTLFSYIRRMYPSLIIAITVFALPFWLKSSSKFFSIPFSILWSSAPITAWVISRFKIKKNTFKISEHDAAYLRKIARRTWIFYETFVTEKDHHLPPDNFQEEPTPILARRTSPTNIGVYLLSILSARDFGWIAMKDVIQRLTKTFYTLSLLEKHCGHLYNWYETDTLYPLKPLYVSTVDSGNLAGHLVALSSSLKEWSNSPNLQLQGNPKGMLDVSGIFEETLENIENQTKHCTLYQDLKKKLKKFQEDVSSLINKKNNIPIKDLIALAKDMRQLTNKIKKQLKTQESSISSYWANSLVLTCNIHVQDAQSVNNINTLKKHLLKLSDEAYKYAFNMIFDFLECKERRLLSIGYRIETNELDLNCYDLLASEARLAIFFAIAKRDIQIEHWFQLGRILVPFGWKSALVSWSGSMFEYLMPPLIMDEPNGSLLYATNRLIIDQQISYAKKRSIPWGTSESAFNSRDSMMNYQYSSFGVASLGLKRGLSRNTVIAPYATILAAQYIPSKAVTNLKFLRKLGALGYYGYYDAIDFTPSRIPQNQSYIIVRNYYAHHHGMSILAVHNVIFDGLLRKNFHKNPQIRVMELLLQEKATYKIPGINAKSLRTVQSAHIFKRPNKHTQTLSKCHLTNHAQSS